MKDIISAATGSNWIIYVVIGVVLVLMIVLTIIPQKKRKKQQETMMNSLNVGTKIMTIGRMVGKITQVNSDNTLIVNVGTESSPTLIVIDKNAVGLVLESVAAPVVAEEPKAADPVAIETTVTDNSEPFEESAENIIDGDAVNADVDSADAPAEEAAEEKPVAKPAKKSKKK